jgi:DNA-binding NarL/FixJ family response regulator
MKIIIADNQPKVRYALTVLIKEQLGWIVISCVSNLQDLLADLNNSDVDLLLLDLQLTGLKSGDIKNRILSLSPDLRIIALLIPSESNSPVIEEGITLFINKIDPPDRLLELMNIHPQ